MKLLGVFLAGLLLPLFHAEAQSTGCVNLYSKRGGDQGLRAYFTPEAGQKLKIKIVGKHQWVGFGMPKEGSVHMNLGTFVSADGVNGKIYDQALSMDADVEPDIEGVNGWIEGTQSVTYEDGFTTLEYTRELAPEGRHPIPESGEFTFLWAAGKVDGEKMLYHTKAFRGHPAYDLANPTAPECEIVYTNCMESGDAKIAWTLGAVREGFEDIQTVHVKVEMPVADSEYVGAGIQAEGGSGANGASFVVGTDDKVIDAMGARGGSYTESSNDGFVWSSFSRADGVGTLEFIRLLAPGGDYVPLTPDGGMQLLVGSGTVDGAGLDALGEAEYEEVAVTLADESSLCAGAEVADADEEDSHPEEEGEAGEGCVSLMSKRGGDQGLRAYFTPLEGQKLKIKIVGKHQWVGFGMPKPDSVHMNLGTFVTADGVNGKIYDQALTIDADVAPDTEGVNGWIEGTQSVTYEDGFTTLEFTRELAPEGRHPIPESGEFTFLWAAGKVDGEKMAYHTKAYRGHPAYDLTQPSTCEMVYTNCMESDDAKISWTLGTVREGFEDIQTMSVKVEMPAAETDYLGAGIQSEGTEGPEGASFVVGTDDKVIEAFGARAGNMDVSNNEGIVWSSFSRADGVATLEFVRLLAPGGDYVPLTPDGGLNLLFGTGAVAGDKTGIDALSKGDYKEVAISLVDESTLCEEAVEETEEEESESHPEEKEEKEEKQEKEKQEKESESESDAEEGPACEPHKFMLKSRGFKRRCLTAGQMMTSWKTCTDLPQQSFEVVKKDRGYSLVSGERCLKPDLKFGPCETAAVFQMAYNADGSLSLKSGPQCLFAVPKGFARLPCGSPIKPRAKYDLALVL